jgi:hypothetical protein
MFREDRDIVKAKAKAKAEAEAEDEAQECGRACLLG